MERINEWIYWNDGMEVSKMVKHTQIILHFEQKYNVVGDKKLTFAGSVRLIENIRKIKFLKLRGIIDLKKGAGLYRLLNSPDVDNVKMATDLIEQYMKLTKGRG